MDGGPVKTIDICQNGTSCSARFTSAQVNVTKVTESAEKWFAGLPIQDEPRADATLVLAEALNNVVEHAYQFAEDGWIELRMNLEPGMLVFAITDQGQAFEGPPEKKIMQDQTETDLADLPEGGFGWFLIHSLCAEISFKRENNRNNLTLKIASGAEAAA